MFRRLLPIIEVISLDVPDHVWQYWKHFGFTKQQILEANRRDLISLKSHEENLRELEAVLKELEQEDRFKSSTTHLHPLVH